MSEYDDVVESALLEEEQVAEEIALEGPSRSRTVSYISLYITGISVLVAGAALATAFAADKWMETTLEVVADRVDYYTLRVESRCHEIQRGLAELKGHPPDENLVREIDRTTNDLAAIESNRKQMKAEAQVSDRAHYTLAIAITFLQMATALAAIVGTTKRYHLIYASVAFACGGIVLTVVGVSRFLA